MIAKAPPPPATYELGLLELETANTKISFQIDALAADDDTREVLLVSAIGAHSSIKALKANLALKTWIVLRADAKPFRSFQTFARSRHGYDFKQHRLGYNTWQLLAVSKIDGLIPKLSSAALWQQLTSERFTTPLLRAWAPDLMQALQLTQDLKPLKCFQCKAALLKATTVELDRIVESGIQRKVLGIE